MQKQYIGIIGLGVMGENLALNFESRGYSVAGYDLDAKKVDNFKKRTAGKRVVPAYALADFLKALESPRRILIMVPAGKAVDSVINDLRPHLSPGDVLIDGGNTFFADTDRRMKALDESGILYMGMGVSGGEEGRTARSIAYARWQSQGMAAGEARAAGDRRPDERRLALLRMGGQRRCRPLCEDGA